MYTYHQLAILPFSSLNLNLMAGWMAWSAQMELLLSSKPRLQDAGQPWHTSITTSCIWFVASFHVLYPPILMMEPSKFRPRTNRKTPPPTIPKISHFGSHVWSQLLCFNRLRAQGKKKWWSQQRGNKTESVIFPTFVWGESMHQNPDLPQFLPEYCAL